MGTAVAYYCWFRGLVRMPAGAVSLVGLVNPVVGTVLGVLFAGELFGWAQALGMVLVLGGVVAGQRLVLKPRTSYELVAPATSSDDVAAPRESVAASLMDDLAPEGQDGGHERRGR